MKKYLFYSLMMVAMVATMSLGLSSCSKDDGPGGGSLYRNWTTDKGGSFNIKKDGTLSILTTNGTVSSKYKINGERKSAYELLQVTYTTEYELDLDPAIQIGNYTFVKMYVYHQIDNPGMPEQIAVVGVDSKNNRTKIGYFYK